MKRIGAVLFCLILSLGLLAPGTALANTPPPPSAEELAIQADINKLYDLNKGTLSKTKLRAALQKEANKRKMTLFVLLESKVIGEALAATPRYLCFNGSHPDSSASRKLAKAKGVGDVFISTSGFWYFGHTGIYSATTKIVHAPGPGKKSRVQNIKTVKVGCGSVLETPDAPKADRKAAASYAKAKLVGRAYNSLLFWANKYSKGAVNCSQLVWLAYKKAAKVDVDANGGWAVYPWNLYHESWVYQVVN